MNIDSLMAFIFASIILLIIPGPTILLVVSYALAKGRKIAFAVVGGVVVGDLLAMTTSIFGLGILLQTSAALFTLMKIIGAIYLIWMGWRMIKGADRAHYTLNDVKEKSCYSAFMDSAIVTFFNPKSIGFFVAFIPQFLDASSPIYPQFSTMIFIFVGLAGINALIYAMLAAHIRDKIANPKIFSYIQKMGGGVLLILAMFTLTVKKV
jgi:threonine/homoserine/homoserine lactone efflux protein